MSNHSKSATFALGAALAGGLALSSSAFAMTDLAGGYMLGAADQAAKAAEGKCGEGKCGVEKMDTDKDGRVSQAEFAAAHDGDASKFAGHDADGDGFLSADELKAKAGKRADKAGMEGKCGEGKCGGMA
ncbi:HvfA family oxazolone/thioamide-modified RiPP metallophore [Vulcaniibacterium tengchongense]|uniref:EF hand domain-containing protein n=1 Tax=Vulcaniibacterium tengchongense TaxID=1273429 RepID=A0A3N4V3H0_9GAMM|nr:calcium-binding protein [Vulcaniibacterium tengchongense]RPE77028.1 EF hand domain-containing protein [Vulcaniibacterium tengchongense]